MGYTISAIFSSEKEKEKMNSFLQKHFQPLADVMKEVSLQHFPLTNRDLIPHSLTTTGGCQPLPALGFRYKGTVPDPERSYIFCFCYWMAMHGGDKKMFYGQGPFPYVNYDSDEDWALVTDKTTDFPFEYARVNEVGYARMSEFDLPYAEELFKKFPSFKQELEVIDEGIHGELQRLSSLWNQMHPTEKETKEG